MFQLVVRTTRIWIDDHFMKNLKRLKQCFRKILDVNTFHDNRPNGAAFWFSKTFHVLKNISDFPKNLAACKIEFKS
jgi:hypothetical protein